MISRILAYFVIKITSFGERQLFPECTARNELGSARKQQPQRQSYRPKKFQAQRKFRE